MKTRFKTAIVLAVAMLGAILSTNAQIIGNGGFETNISPGVLTVIAGDPAITP